ncbi:polysaccharide deacetylase family protein [Rhodoblastus acidophilus]|uniref:Chitooligosaccharide deacetylase n=1 Tax=Rhodoblastus acidophilus TaxID=1074 RepID=A0A6N8DMK3_RHOAC|nr:polysaccharide deacetylase family protein [Rhodoblastus acidophilus]MCW2275410.1 peptidoglycan/xylan/chitin deacetylase (PgdA/CDA1 family) [Rhodoblastus acidophilus]MTV31699.1 polysaccharide deacetylase family protein [Rhodoblastus acidophilus]
MSLKRHMVAAGFSLFRRAGLHRLAGAGVRGRGVILTLHRVRPADCQEFAPNALLEITPAFLDAALTRLRASGLDLVTLDEALRRLVSGEGANFAVLTFDDGFRDAAEHALPVLERHRAPFMTYITPGLASRTARLWWVELEEAVRRLDHIQLGGQNFSARDAGEKAAAFDKIYWTFRAQGEKALLDGVALLRDRAGVDPVALVERLCLDWDGLRRLAQCDLAGFGAHSMTHPRLRQLPQDQARAEMVCSREVLERELGRACPHFAYPVGDPTSAGPREFALAEELGFASAVTTRPGMIFPEHAAHLHALPRVSVNGLWQDIASLDILLSGAPFLLWNFGRRVNVA